MMAAACIGAYPDVAACAADWASPSLGAATPPEPTLSKQYAELFSIYRRVRDDMAPTWARLSELRREDRP